MRAIEVSGKINAQGQFQLDQLLAFAPDSRVRAILLFHETAEDEELEWLKLAANNPTFQFLNDPEEDIYTLEDGEPCYDYC
jgi:hypothetical protein